MDRENYIESLVSDAMTQKPIRFSIKYQEEEEIEVSYKKDTIIPFIKKLELRLEKKLTDKEKSFTISPPTLGKMQILSKLYLQLELNDEELNKEPHNEAMRVCESKTDVVCNIMAVSVLSKKEELLDDKLIEETANFFKYNCYPEDFSTCLLAILTQVDYQNFMSSIRLTKILRLNKPKMTKRADRVE